MCIFFRTDWKRKPSLKRATSESYLQSKDDQPSWSLAKNPKRHSSKFLYFYGKTEESREAYIREKITFVFKGYFNRRNTNS